MVGLLSHMMGLIHRFDEDEKAFFHPESPMTKWISGSTGDNASTDPNCDNTWNKGDCFGGKMVEFELPKLSYYLVCYYMLLAQRDIEIKDEKAQIPEIFTLLPPNSDGAIHTDKDMECANALFKLGFKPKIVYSTDGTVNAKSKEIPRCLDGFQQVERRGRSRRRNCP